MTWTRTTPTTPGWYWYSEASWHMVVRLSGGGFVYGIVGMPHISQLQGKWSSEPIAEPEEVS